MLARWLVTVRGLIKSRSPISRLESPSAIRRSTSSSRGERMLCAAGKRLAWAVEKVGLALNRKDERSSLYAAGTFDTDTRRHTYGRGAVKCQIPTPARLPSHLDMVPIDRPDASARIHKCHDWLNAASREQPERISADRTGRVTFRKDGARRACVA